MPSQVFLMARYSSDVSSIGLNRRCSMAAVASSRWCVGFGCRRFLVLLVDMVLATNTRDYSLVKAGDYISSAHEVFRWFPLT
jgi:hypothetical protein